MEFLQLQSVRCLIIIAVHVSPSDAFFPLLSGNIISSSIFFHRFHGGIEVSTTDFLRKNENIHEIIKISRESS